LWDANDGQRIFIRTVPGLSVVRVAFSPDGKQIASELENGIVKLWDAVEGKELSSFHGRTRPIHGVAYGPDGKWLITATNKGGTIWDVHETTD
jgi:WD40 repeat protein